MSKLLVCVKIGGNNYNGGFGFPFDQPEKCTFKKKLAHVLFGFASAVASAASLPGLIMCSLRASL